MRNYNKWNQRNLISLWYHTVASFRNSLMPFIICRILKTTLTRNTQAWRTQVLQSLNSLKTYPNSMEMSLLFHMISLCKMNILIWIWQWNNLMLNMQFNLISKILTSQSKFKIKIRILQHRMTYRLRILNPFRGRRRSFSLSRLHF